VATAGRAGEIEAELADLKHRLKESQEREKRLVERVFLAEERLDDALSTEHELRIQIHRYAEFNRAVQRSRPWRMIQFLRRLVGREW
jgi:septal ring factor EnvC (AmiA/AmiB activator)